MDKNAQGSVVFTQQGLSTKLRQQHLLSQQTKGQKFARQQQIEQQNHLQIQQRRVSEQQQQNVAFGASSVPVSPADRSVVSGTMSTNSSPTSSNQSKERPPQQEYIEIRIVNEVANFLSVQIPNNNAGSSQAARPATSAATPPSIHHTENTPAPAIPQSGPGVRFTEDHKQPKPPVAAGPSSASTPRHPATLFAQQTATLSPSTSRGAKGVEYVNFESAQISLEPTTPGEAGKISGEIDNNAAKSSAPSELVSNDSITTRRSELDDFLNSIQDSGGEWKELGRYSNGFGTSEPNQSPKSLAVDAPKFDINADWAANQQVNFAEDGADDSLQQLRNIQSPDMSEERRRKDLKEFLDPEKRADGEANNPQDTYNPAPGIDWTALSPAPTPQEEAEPAEGIAQPAFALNEGPYVSNEDAFNHYLNQQLGTGWEGYADSTNPISDRPAGNVDLDLLETIQKGEWAPTIFEFGHVEDFSSDKSGPSS